MKDWHEMSRESKDKYIISVWWLLIGIYALIVLIYTLLTRNNTLETSPILHTDTLQITEQQVTYGLDGVYIYTTGLKQDNNIELTAYSRDLYQIALNCTDIQTEIKEFKGDYYFYIGDMIFKQDKTSLVLYTQNRKDDIYTPCG